MTTALLCIAVAAAFLPEAFASLGTGTPAAWHYVMGGIQTAALWAIVGAAASGIVVRCVSAWGFMEAAEQAACRLALPMTRAPSLLPGQNLCDAATGLPATWLSVLAALFVAALVQEERHG